MNIEIKNLLKMYNDTSVLNLDEFQVSNIKSLAIIGPSGGGKSSLLKILGTIEDAKADILRVNGHDVLSEVDRSQYLKEIGYVFQSNNLFPNLTVLENITIHLLHTYNMNQEEAYERAKLWLEKVDILEHKDKYPHEISGGQAQRVAIVRALVSGASLLLLDEPTSALDPKLAYEVMQTLLKIKEESDIIIVTHELNFARQFADYFIFVEQGRIISHGPIDSLFNNNNSTVQDFVKMIEFK